MTFLFWWDKLRLYLEKLQSLMVVEGRSMTALVQVEKGAEEGWANMANMQPVHKTAK